MLTFLSFQLDPENRTLTEEGKQLPLPPKAFDLLVLMAQNQGRLFTKEELLERVWAGTFVEEGNLSKAVWLLRRTLRDDAAQIIQTVPRKGYRFEAEVSTETRAPAAKPDYRADQRPALAVLAFKDMTPEADQQYFCEGIAEEILNRLAQQGGLRVASRTSSFQLTNHSAAEIAERLGVEYVLEGSVRKASDRIRIGTQLIHTVDNFQVWSQTFDRTMGDVFAIQDEIADAVASMFAFSLQRGAGKFLTRPLTSDVEAYRLYLQGRYHWNHRPGEPVEKAIECFEKAIARDPKFALAHAGLADAYNTLGSWEFGAMPPMQALVKSKASASRALEAAPDLPEALTSIGYADLHFDGNCSQACARFERALQGNPDYSVAHHWYAHALLASGRTEEALQESQKILQLEPADLLMQSHMVWHHWMTRQGERALEHADRCLHLDSHFPWFHYFRGGGLLLLGEIGRAIDAYHEAAQLTGDLPVMRAGLAYALAAGGERVQALQIVAELKTAKGLYGYELGVVQVALGDLDHAFELLERAKRERSGWLVYAHLDHRLDPVRSDPRFANLRPSDWRP